MIHPPEEGAPHNISGRKPDYRDWIYSLKEIVMCLGVCFILLVMIVFILMCVLLSKTNTNEVKEACNGLWEFMLVAVLSPIIVPLFYCLYSCLFFLLCPWKWNIYFGACMLILGITGLHVSITMSENVSCVAALKESTPPLPLLLYASWIKTIICFCGAFSSFYAMRN
jgi:uncharacterized BrkB/YihY/UPF0761 family membrane protein